MSKEAIKDFVGCRSIAVVGASAAPRGKYGNVAVRELKARGLDVMLVHPTARTLEGMDCAPTLAALPRKPDGVFVCVQPGKVGAVLRDVAAAGIGRVWLQQGAESAEAEALAQELGLRVASGACILMYMQPVRGFHGFHRAVVRLFGRLQPT